LCRAEEPLRIRDLSYGLGLAEEFLGSRELSDALGRIGPTLDVVDSRASWEKEGLLFLLVLSRLTLGVDRVLQAEVP
jgi:hypothetical protein